VRLDQATRTAITATLHCLTGCAVGEILGLALATWWGWSNGPSLALAIGLAFVFGYSFTLVPVLRTGVGVRRAVAIALAADTVSIVTMEIVDNAVVLAVPGAMDAALTDVLFWGSLAFSLVVAFVVTVPVNRWLIGRGKGHAVVHDLHHGGHDDHGAAPGAGYGAQGPATVGDPHAGHEAPRAAVAADAHAGHEAQGSAVAADAHAGHGAGAHASTSTG
jgi:hypothetical protein